MLWTLIYDEDSSKYRNDPLHFNVCARFSHRSTNTLSPMSFDAQESMAVFEADKDRTESHVKSTDQHETLRRESNTLSIFCCAI